jgi:serine/threonine protein phosphatase PrpC
MGGVTRGLRRDVNAVLFVQGDIYSIHLEPGDVLILASDGMYDNVWPEQILDITLKARGGRVRRALHAGMQHSTA